MSPLEMTCLLPFFANFVLSCFFLRPNLLWLIVYWAFCLRSSVCVCVAAVTRQRVRRPPQDLHPPAGQWTHHLHAPSASCRDVFVSVNSLLSFFQVDGKSLSLKQFMEEPTLSLVSETIPFYQLLQSVSPLNSKMLWKLRSDFNPVGWDRIHPSSCCSPSLAEKRPLSLQDVIKGHSEVTLCLCALQQPGFVSRNN